MGLIVSVIAMISGWGLTMYVGSHPWQATNLASVFLLLGVGIDDTFVMLSAWKRIQGNLLRGIDNKTVLIFWAIFLLTSFMILSWNREKLLLNLLSRALIKLYHSRLSDSKRIKGNLLKGIDNC